MPELPEVQTIVFELNRKIAGKKIKSVEIRAPKIISIGPGVVSNIRKSSQNTVKEFIRLLKEERIVSVKRRAKLLIFDLSPSSVLRTPSPSKGEGKAGKASLSLLVHLKMTGQFIFEDKKLRKKTKGFYRVINNLSSPKIQLPGKHTHVIFTFLDGSRLFYNDVRRFGYLKLVKDSELDQVKELKEFGPEPLSKDFTTLHFLTAVRKCRVRKIKIKQLLMEPKFVAGIGNIYSDEILFHSKIRPTRPVSGITNQELKMIYRNIIKVLEKAIEAKGSSVGDFIRTDGSFGKMGKYHYVYGRGGEKCKVCGTTIKSVKINGRTGSFCPKCQK